MNLSLTLFDLIGDLARRRYQAAERGFAVVGLNHTGARLLTLLDRAGGTATQEALSNAITVDRSNAGRALKHLEQTGLIARRPDEANRKTNLVQITSAGRATVVELDRIQDTMAREFFANLNEHDAAALVTLLRKTIGVDDHDDH